MGLTMSDAINKLNDDLIELFNKHHEAEELFNLGVGFGKYLEKNKLEDVRLEFFVQHELRKETRTAIYEDIDTLNDSLFKLVKMAFKEEINLNVFECWEIDTSSFSGHKHELSEEIVKKYNFQVISVSQPTKWGDFELTCMLTGKLAEIVEKYQFKKVFSVSYSSASGEEYETIYEDDISSFYGVHLYFNIEADIQSMEKAAKCVHELSQEILHLTIKNS